MNIDNENRKRVYSLTFALATNRGDEEKLEKLFKVAYCCYKDAFNVFRKRLDAYYNDREYKELIDRAIARKEENEKVVFTTEDKDKFKELQEQYKLRFGSFPDNELRKKLLANYNTYLNDNIVSAIIVNVQAGVKKVLFDKGERISIKKYRDFTSINAVRDNGLCVRNDNLIYKRNNIDVPIIIESNKEKIIKAFNNDKIKYVILKRKVTNNGWKYLVNIHFDGVPVPSFDTKDGVRVGVDVTSAYIGVVTNDFIYYEHLFAPEQEDAKIRLLNRKLDRQRRASNPNKYNDDGTIKKGNKDKWFFTKEYRKTQNELKLLRQHRADTVEYHQNRLANLICSFGNDIVIAQKDFENKRKRTKETTIDENGKYKSKASKYAKSIQNNAPSQLIDKVKTRMEYIDGNFMKVSGTYEHTKLIDIFTGAELGIDEEDKYVIINGKKINTTVYYAYVLTGYNKESDSLDYNYLTKNFDNFYDLYRKRFGK